MRQILLIQFVALALFVWTGCSKSTPAASAPAPAKAPASAPEAAPAAQKPASSPSAPAAVAKAPAKADESDLAPAPERKPEVTKEECDKACAHATKLTMASMPPDATPEMKAAIQKALVESCPKDCIASGTKARVACILKAKSGMEMAAECQK
ncbi:MAG: hypothetical protein QF464_15255 [Myxococcota bacterium]|jgi:hypothetical protein|nr:hypothetical protein [Myxococcota bacterium]